MFEMELGNLRSIAENENWSLTLLKCSLSIVFNGWNSPDYAKVTPPKTYSDSPSTVDEASHLDSFKHGSCYQIFALTWNLSTALEVFFDDS